MFVKRLIPGASSAGHYTSAKAIARAALPVFYALSSAIYPALSNAYATGDSARFREYIHKAHRSALMVLLPLTIVVTWDSGEILSTLFGNDYVEGAPVLAWLTLSFSFLALFIVHKSIITGCGFPTIVSLLTSALLPLCIILQLILIPVFGLAGAALACALTHMVGAGCSMTIVQKKFRAGFHLTSTVRIVCVSFLLFFLDVILTWSGLGLIPKLIILATLYLLGLGACRELRFHELREFLADLQKGSEKNQMQAAAPGSEE
jgi:O-antigen/teichoic acid export membrane protein